MTVATTDVKIRAPWRFWAGLAGVCACEVVTLLVGFHVLPSKIGEFRWSSVIPPVALPFGFSIEMWMQIMRGVPTSTDKESLAVFSRSTVFGMTYFVPVFAAAVGSIIPWMLACSIAAFLGLMARVAWLYMTRPSAKAA